MLHNGHKLILNMKPCPFKEKDCCQGFSNDPLQPQEDLFGRSYLDL